VKVAIMQPYFLPYIGYWQLIAAVDKFVILDDVNYINRGWINRNRIAVNGSPHWMTLPLQSASQNKLICELDLVADDNWRVRLRRTVRHAYSKAPNLDFASALFDELLHQAHGNLSSFLFKTIVWLCSVFRIETEIVPSSRIFPKKGLTGSERLIDICKQLGATQYVNPPGGTELYKAHEFSEAKIMLCFLRPQLEYADLDCGSNDGTMLSILDTLMFNQVNEVVRCVFEKRILDPKH